MGHKKQENGRERRGESRWRFFGQEGDSQKEVSGGAKEEQRRSLSVFGPSMISTLFCVFSVQKVLSFFIYI